MTISKELVTFSSQNPCLPVELFLSIVEHESEFKDAVKLAMSRIDPSSLDEHPVLSELEEGITWAGFKSLMEKTFHREPSHRDNVQLLRSLVKGDSEDNRHYLLRTQYVAGTILNIIFVFCQLRKLKSADRIYGRTFRTRVVSLKK